MVHYLKSDDNNIGICYQLLSYMYPLARIFVIVLRIIIRLCLFMMSKGSDTLIVTLKA